MKVEQQEAATRFWYAVFHLERTWQVIYFSRTKGPIMRYLYIWWESFSKIDSTFFSVDKIAVLIVLQKIFLKTFTAVVFLLMFRQKKWHGFS